MKKEITESNIGKLAILRERDLEFNVHIMDERKSFGRTDVLIKPAMGNGEQWVQLTSVEII